MSQQSGLSQQSREVEEFADPLRRWSEGAGVPNDSGHHGSLLRELREEAEAALKMGTAAATAICTATLGLGCAPSNGDALLLLTWWGDQTNDALALLLTGAGQETTSEGLFLSVARTEEKQALSALHRLAKDAPARSGRMQDGTATDAKAEVGLDFAAMALVALVRVV